MKFTTIIFDMDGTILDTLDDLRDALNVALAANAMPERIYDEVRRFVGNGIGKLIDRGVPSGTSVHARDRVYADFMEYYTVHCADKTHVYPGIVQLLGYLRASGCRTAVVSNKADAAVQSLVVSYFNGLFDAAVGEREGVRKKPSPDSVNEVIRSLGADRADCIYIGDSDVDAATAAAAGLPCILVDWGFRDRELLETLGAAAVVSSTDEIIRFLGTN